MTTDSTTPLDNDEQATPFFLRFTNLKKTMRTPMLSYLRTPQTFSRHFCTLRMLRVVIKVGTDTDASRPLLCGTFCDSERESWPPVFAFLPGEKPRQTDQEDGESQSPPPKIQEEGIVVKVFSFSPFNRIGFQLQEVGGLFSA